MPPAIASARREAIGAFGDDDLLVERFVEHPRHIEIQVLADAHDSVVHSGSASAASSGGTRGRRGGAVRVPGRRCRALRWGRRPSPPHGLRLRERRDGRVHRVRRRSRRAFFLEMNTRLQVEHPVTEMAWGVDLVELQLRIAAGEPLPFRQDDLRPRGHAVEARVYAEDPQRGSSRRAGRVLALTEPCGDGIRVDSALACGLEVGATYDPMLAKVVAWAPRRADALHRLDRALGETNVLGVTTNIAFLRRLLLHPDVVAGRLDTGLIERDLELLVEDTIPDDVVAAAALSSARRETPSDAWDAGGGWRIGEHAPTHWSADVDGRQISVVVRPAGASHTVRIGNGDAVTARLTGVDAPTGTAAALQLGDRTSRLLVARDGPVVWVARDGASWSFREPEAIRRPAPSARGRPLEP
jgi:acetyl-CoA/propionyl-CoA carboxylase biotin carboxyl carrier protein